MSHVKNLPCPICGQSSYLWGNTQGYHKLKLKNEDTPLLEKITVFGGKEVISRLCQTCGNVQLFVRDFVNSSQSKT